MVPSYTLRAPPLVVGWASVMKLPALYAITSCVSDFGLGLAHNTISLLCFGQWNDFSILFDEYHILQGVATAPLWRRIVTLWSMSIWDTSTHCSNLCGMSQFEDRATLFDGIEPFFLSSSMISRFLACLLGNKQAYFTTLYLDIYIHICSYETYSLFLNSIQLSISVR